MAFISTLVRGAIGLAALAALWEVFALSQQNPLFYPDLAAILGKAAELSATAEFQRHAVTSLSTLAFGLAPAVLLGIVVGLVLRASHVLRTVLGPLVMVLAAVPFVAAAPLLVVWRGIGTEAQAILVFLLAAFPIMNVVMTETAPRADRPPRAADAPVSPPLPHRSTTACAIVAGLRWGLILAVTGVVVGEMIASTAGLGHLIMQLMASFAVAGVAATVLVIAVPVVAAVVFLQAVEAQLAAAADR